MHSEQNWNVACTGVHVQWKLPHTGVDGDGDGTDGAGGGPAAQHSHTVPAPAACLVSPVEASSMTQSHRICCGLEGTSKGCLVQPLQHPQPEQLGQSYIQPGLKSPLLLLWARELCQAMCDRPCVCAIPCPDAHIYSPWLHRSPTGYSFPCVYGREWPL